MQAKDSGVVLCIYLQEILTYFEKKPETAMDDNATTNNETDTYAPENVYPIDALQSPNQPPLPPITFDDILGYLPEITTLGNTVKPCHC